MMMPTIAYIANEFPSPVEPYVGEEILELRRRGMPVVPCGVRRPRATLDAGLRSFEGEAIYLRPLRTVNFLRGAWLCVLKFGCLSDLVGRVLLRGSEESAAAWLPWPIPGWALVWLYRWPSRA